MVTIDYNIIIIITKTIARFLKLCMNIIWMLLVLFYDKSKKESKMEIAVAVAVLSSRVFAYMCDAFFFVLYYYIITAIDRRDKYLIRFIALSPDAIAECYLTDRTRIYQPKLIPDRFENLKKTTTTGPYFRLLSYDVGTYNIMHLWYIIVYFTNNTRYRLISAKSL